MGDEINRALVLASMRDSERKDGSEYNINMIRLIEKARDSYLGETVSVRIERWNRSHLVLKP